MLHFCHRVHAAQREILVAPRVPTVTSLPSSGDASSQRWRSAPRAWSIADGNPTTHHEARHAHRHEFRPGRLRPRIQRVRPPRTGRFPEFAAEVFRHGRDDVAGPRPDGIPPGSRRNGRKVEFHSPSGSPPPVTWRWPARALRIRAAGRKEDRMTHDFPIASARRPRRAARARPCAARRGPAAASATARDMRAYGASVGDASRDNTRCRAFAAGDDP